MAALIAVVNVKADNLVVSDQVIMRGQSKTCVICINYSNAKSYVAFQMDLTLPEGISINKEESELGNCINDEQQELIIGKLGDNKYRLTSTSFNLIPFNFYNREVIRLSLRATDNTTGGVATLSNIKFVQNLTNSVNRIGMGDITFKISIVDIINFADEKVKSICVANWDKNQDGELDTEESASVKNLSNLFKGNQEITSFVEFQYFTGIEGLGEAFSGCTCLESIVLPNSLIYIYQNAFKNCSCLTSIALPNHVTSIGSSAFEGCSSLTMLNLPNDLTAIESRTFYGCKKLVSAVIPEGVKSIGAEAFQGCEALSTISIPNSVETIETNSFLGCISLTNLNIPSSVVTLGNGAFEGCNGLTTVIARKNFPISINCPVFSNQSNATLIVPIGSKNIYEVADYWKDFNNIVEREDVIDDGPFVFVVDNIKYYYDKESRDNSLSVIGQSLSGYGTIDLVIPEKLTYYGTEYTVIEICDDAFDNCNAIKTVVLPPSIRALGDRAFRYCRYMVSIQLAEGLEQIGTSTFGNAMGTFHGCNNLTEIKIPNTVTIIGRGAFCNCTSLISLIIPNSVTTLGENAFDGCSGLKAITLSQNITEIERETFRGCEKLLSICIPSKVVSIGRNAFHNCSNLKTVNVMASTPFNITSDCFPNQYKATLYVPVGAKEFFEVADYWKKFSKIVELAQGTPIVFVDKNVKALCTTNWDLNRDGELDTNEAATVKSLTDVFKGNSEITSFKELQYFIGLTTIGASDFKGCNSLTEIIIPQSVVDIEEQSFEGLSALKTVDLPQGITSIKWRTFWMCKKLKYAIIPEGVTSIENDAFAGCEDLSILSLPNSLKNIGGGAFNSCYALASLNIPNGVTSIGGGAFLGCKNIKSIYIPSSVTELGQDYFGYSPFSSCSGVSSIVVDSGNPNYDSRYDCNAIIDTNTNLLILGCKNSNIPNGIKGIVKYAFYNCSDLTSIVVPNSVMSIGENAFQGCTNLTSIYIPNNLSNLGAMAFYECSSLTNIEIPNRIQSIENHTFYGCSALTIVEIPSSVTTLGFMAFAHCSSLSCIVIPKSITEMGGYVFEGCSSLSSIRIPNSINYINEHSFDGCSSLTNIEIPKNVTYIDKYAFKDCDNLLSVIVKNPTPFSVLSNSFSDTSTPTLYVPSGCMNAYKNATNWSSFRNVKEIKTNTEVENLENVIYANSIIGLKNEKSTLPIGLNNINPTNAYSFELELPEGVKLALNQEGNYFYELSNRHNNHVASISYNKATGIYTFSVQSPQSQVLNGNEGIVMNLQVEIDDDTELGDYDIMVRNAQYSLSSSSSNISTPYVSSKIKIANFAKGDANCDELINVEDIVSMVNYIIGCPSSSFHFSLADVNSDSEVDVFDLTKVIGIILTEPSLSRTRSYGNSSYNETINLEKALVIPNDNSVYLSVERAERFTAFQFEVILPEGTDISDVVFAKGMSSHQILYTKLDENKYIVVGLSMNNDLIPTSVAKLIEVKLTGPANGDLYFNNIIFVTNKEEKVRFIDERLNISEVNNEKETIYSLNGLRINRLRNTINKGVYIINNKKVIIK